MSVYLKLVNVQTKLKAPKSQYNKFGKYSFRNCEDILEALKPLIEEEKAIVSLSDSVVLIGERYYIEASAKFIDAETGEIVEVKGLAREEDSKKGMDSSQLTGSTSSYARKYALNGLFAIDDTKDSDTTNTHGKSDSKPKQTNNNINIKPNMNPVSEANIISEGQMKRMYVLAKGKAPEMVKEIITKYGFTSSKDVTRDKYKNICDEIEKL